MTSIKKEGGLKSFYDIIRHDVFFVALRPLRLPIYVPIF